MIHNSNIQFDRVMYTQHPAIAMILQLYEEAFPLHERRTSVQLLQLLNEPDMEMLAIANEKEYIGFAIVWKLSGWHYLEHFAIAAAHRSKQYGSAVIKQLIAYAENRLVLEVERPHDDIARRRIGFYKRPGFIVSPFAYRQPPYRKGEDWVPMVLMSTPAFDNETVFNAVVAQIQSEVYMKYH